MPYKLKLEKYLKYSLGLYFELLGTGSSEIDDGEHQHQLKLSDSPSKRNALSIRNSNDDSYFFTLNPDELIGERIHSSLVKSLRGLGITIVGGDDSKEEFLQIKSVVPNGPAALEGHLQTGEPVNSTTK